MGTHPIFESDFDCLTDGIGTQHKMKKIHRRLSLFLNPETQVPDLGKISEEKHNVGDNNEERDTFNEDIKETSNRVRLRKPKKKHEAIKRLSLPTDIRLPDEILAKFARDNPALASGGGGENLTRKNRRASLSEIGFGKLESYQKLDKLGEGTYATVFKGKSKLTDKIVALKEIRLEFEEGAPCTAIREVSLLRGLKQANIVTLHDIIHTQSCLTLVFEYLERDLKQYMDDMSGVKLAMNNVRIFLFQLLRGLTYCHKMRILHRDLKPQTLLINQKGELKLADFGLARAKSVPTKTYSNEVVTLWYRPPDVLPGSTEYTTAIDMWGVGCIFYEMVTGRPLFAGQNVKEQLLFIFKKRGTPTEENWNGITSNKKFLEYEFRQYQPEPLETAAPRLDHYGRELLIGFLKYETEQRISARNALHHSTFKPLGPEIYKLKDEESIFSINEIQITANPGSSRAKSSGKNRRHSTFINF